MPSEDLSMILLGIIASVALAFYCGVIIKRHERTISSFYWALSEKYVHSYVTPNKVVKFVRKRCGLETNHKVHWMICLFHYLQIVMVVLPPFMLIHLFFLPAGQTALLLYIVGVGPCGLIGILDGMLLFLQCCRCEKIKKTNPEYAKRELYNWRA